MTLSDTFWTSIMANNSMKKILKKLNIYCVKEKTLLYLPYLFIWF